MDNYEMLFEDTVRRVQKGYLACSGSAVQGKDDGRIIVKSPIDLTPRRSVVELVIKLYGDQLFCAVCKTNESQLFFRCFHYFIHKKINVFH